MYERSYGYKYNDPVGTGSAADIAKAIRADIAQAVKEGLLPARWSYSVRSDTFSGGCSIDVTVKNCADAWKRCDRITCHYAWCKSGGIHRELPAAEDHDILTEEAESAEMTLKRVHHAYNHDGSEIQVDYFDVRYYGQVHFQDARSARFDAEEKARKQTRRAALDAATDVRRVKVYGRQGKRTVHLATEVDGKVRLLCGAQLWGHSFYSVTEDEISCSRCAKRN